MWLQNSLQNLLSTIVYYCTDDYKEVREVAEKKLSILLGKKFSSLLIDPFGGGFSPCLDSPLLRSLLSRAVKESLKELLVSVPGRLLRADKSRQIRMIRLLDSYFQVGDSTIIEILDTNLNQIIIFLIQIYQLECNCSHSAPLSSSFHANTYIPPFCFGGREGEERGEGEREEKGERGRKEEEERKEEREKWKRRETEAERRGYLDFPEKRSLFFRDSLSFSSAFEIGRTIGRIGRRVGRFSSLFFALKSFLSFCEERGERERGERERGERGGGERGGGEGGTRGAVCVALLQVVLGAFGPSYCLIEGKEGINKEEEEILETALRLFLDLLSYSTSPSRLKQLEKQTDLKSISYSQQDREREREREREMGGKAVPSIYRPFLLQPSSTDSSERTLGTPDQESYLHTLSLLALESIIAIALSLRHSFKKYLYLSLYPLLSTASHSCPVVSLSSLFSLRAICGCVGCESVSLLIEENSDYFVNSFSQKMRFVSSYPSTPQVISGIVRHLDVDVVQYLGDTIEDLFFALSVEDRQITEGVLEAISGIVSSILNKRMKERETNLSLTHEKEERKEKEKEKEKEEEEGDLQEAISRDLGLSSLSSFSDPSLSSLSAFEKAKALISEIQKEKKKREEGDAKPSIEEVREFFMDHHQKREEEEEWEGDEEEEEEGEEEVKENKEDELVCQILRECGNYLSSSTPPVQAIALLETISKGIQCLSPSQEEEEEEKQQQNCQHTKNKEKKKKLLLPLIHDLWPSLSSSLFGYIGLSLSPLSSHKSLTGGTFEHRTAFLLSHARGQNSLSPSSSSPSSSPSSLSLFSSNSSLSPLSSQGKKVSEEFVCMKCMEVVAICAESCHDFIASKFEEDLWPFVVRSIPGIARLNIEKRHTWANQPNEAYKFEASFRLQEATLTVLQRIGKAGGLQSVLSVADTFWVYLDERQPLYLQKETISLMKILAEIDPDSFFLILGDLCEVDLSLRYPKEGFQKEERHCHLQKPPSRLCVARVLCPSLSPKTQKQTTKRKKEIEWSVSRDWASHLFSYVQKLEMPKKNKWKSG